MSATSAGAANAVVLAQGLLRGDKEEARAVLSDFWYTISQSGIPFSLFKPPYSLFSPDPYHQFSLRDSILYIGFDYMTRLLSPYQFNPFNINPLKMLLESKVDFDAIRNNSTINIFVCATNVETCKVRIFSTPEINIDTVLASACLPNLFQSVPIEGTYYWDGGYIGNPAIFPLIYDCASKDVVIVHVNPIVRKGEPKQASQILNRLNEVSFNSSLIRELRAISFVSKLIDDGAISDKEMKKMRIHSIRSDSEMSHYCDSSKVNTDWTFLSRLKEQGRNVAENWLSENFNKIGSESSVNINSDFL